MTAMTRQLRTLAGAAGIIGVLAMLAYAIPPLRSIGPWFAALPGLVQVGLGAFSVALLLVIVSLVVERFEDSGHDRSLLKD